MSSYLAHFPVVKTNVSKTPILIADMRALDMDEGRVNIHGGAVALGHPIGASGTRILITLLGAMERQDAASGMATLCLGGGNAVALSVERA